MNMLHRKAGESRGRAGCTKAGAGALTFWTAALGLALFATAAQAQTGAPQAAYQKAERTALEQRVQGLISETIKRRAVRTVGDAVVERDARRLAASLTDRELRDAFDRQDASAVVDAALAKAAATAAAATLGDSNSDLVFVPVPPCRIIDTRLAGGTLAAFETRAFKVNGVDAFQAQGGKDGGCGIPADAVPPQATAAMLNFVAVTPQGAGDLRAWPYSQPKPFSSIINYSSVNIANGVIVPIAGSSLYPADLNVSTDVSGTDLVVDVTGYFTRFPIDGFNAQKPSTTQVDSGAVSLANTSLQSCLPVNSCNVTTTVNGRVLVQAWAQANIDHTQGTPERMVIGIKNSAPTVCSNFNETVNAVDFEVPDVQPTDPGVETVMDDSRLFFQSASDGTVSYYVNGAMVIGASSGDQIKSSRIICTFYPD